MFGVARAADGGLIGFGDTEQHADDPHRHLRGELGDEVEPFGADKRIEELRAEGPDRVLQRRDLAWGENPGHETAMDRVGGWVLGRHDSGRHVDPGLNEFEHVAAS